MARNSVGKSANTERVHALPTVEGSSLNALDSQESKPTRESTEEKMLAWGFIACILFASTDTSTGTASRDIFGVTSRIKMSATNSGEAWLKIAHLRRN